MKFLITTGPTQENIDAVRYISNRSSGKMGNAVAHAAYESGHKVKIISGPITITPPKHVDVIDVVSAKDMYEACMKEFPWCDCLIMCAAVADYRIAEPVYGKIKKSTGELTLKLVPTIDILQEISKVKGDKILVGFALETDDGLHNALDKLKRKNLDYIVLNHPGTFGSDYITAQVIDKNEVVTDIHHVTKDEFAKVLVAMVNDLYRTRNGKD